MSRATMLFLTFFTTTRFFKSIKSEICVCKYCDDYQCDYGSQEAANDSFYKPETDQNHQYAKSIKYYIFRHFSIGEKTYISYWVPSPSERLGEVLI